MAIFLIRHAQSEANIQLKTSSHAEIALSQLGHQQAENLCHQLPYIHHVMASQFLRAQQTAQPLLRTYHLELQIDEDIHEFSYLSEQKCANTNMQERKAWVDEYWQHADPDYKDGEDAESFTEFYTRVRHFHENLKHLILHYRRKNLAVISHGQFLMLLLMQMEQPQACSQQLMQEFRQNLLNQPIANAQIITLEEMLHLPCAG